MASDPNATWEKDGRRITGGWRYIWSADKFAIRINVPDEITGAHYRTFSVYGDHPEWNGWKLAKEPAQSGDEQR